MRLLYTLLLYAALPWFLARLWWRGRREPGYREAIAERFGEGAPEGDGPLIWAASALPAILPSGIGPSA